MYMFVLLPTPTKAAQVQFKKFKFSWLTLLVSQSLVKFKKISGWLTVTKTEICTSDVRMYTPEGEPG